MMKQQQIVTGLLAAACCAGAGTQEHKNVLFIAVDDLRPELGCYGTENVFSPRMDALAKEGMVFERNYVQMAVCIPSRACAFTSTRPERTHQVYGDMRWQNAEGARPIGRTFSDAGYETLSLGKLWHTERKEPHGDAFDVEWKAWGKKYADPENQRKMDEQWKRYQAGQATGKPYKEDLNLLPAITEAADVDDEGYNDGMLARRAVKELQRMAQGDKPFLMMIGFEKPHLPFNAPEKYWDLYSEADMPLAPNPDYPQGMPEIAFNGNPNFYSYSYGDYEPLPPGMSRMPERTARHLVHGYRACVSYVDTQIGRVLDELDRLGLADSTIVVLWGDHGWHLGDNGMWSKHTNYEVAAHSPLIIRAPGWTTPGTRSEALVETIDLFPTLLDYCGLSPLTLADGRSLKPEMTESSATGKDAVFHCFNRWGEEVIGFAVRTDRYRLVSWRKGWSLSSDEVATELYDYEADPHETVNQATNPEYADVVQKLQTMLKEKHREYLQ